MKNEAPFTEVATTARQLGLPARWLKREAQAGRLPHIVAGKEILLHIPTVKAALDRRMAASIMPEVAHAGE